MKVKVYIPKRDTEAHKRIDQGSGIVGRSFGEDHVELYFEGNRYDAVNVRTWEQKVAVAAGRMSVSYPTVAKMVASKDELLEVGEYDTQSRETRWVNTPSSVPVIIDWLLPDDQFSPNGGVAA